MENKKKKILIATPIHTDNLILQNVTSVFNIINNKNFEVNIFWRRGSLVNRCRNELLGYFLESNYEYIFFIDSDIVDFVDSFYKIILSYFELEKSIPLLVLGAVYPIKYFNFDYLKNNNQINEVDWNQILLNYNVNIKNLNINNDLIIKESDNNNGLVDVESIAGGFMMFSRFVLNKMIEEYPESAYNNFYNDTLLAKKNYNLFHSFVEPNSKFYLSEDYGFCYNFKKIGGKILADIKVKLSHYGEQIFTGSLYESLKLRNENNNIKKKNLLLSIPRSGNHIIRTLIEYFTELPTAGLIGVENDGPIYTRSKINFEIKNKNKFIYYKQHDLILNEKYYLTKHDEVNELIFLIRNPLEKFIREDNYNNENKELIEFKKRFKEVYFNNIDFYQNFQGKKLLLYYEDIIQNKKDTINKVYNFLNINDQDKLEYVINNITTIYDETLKLSKSTNGGISSDVNYYSTKFKDTINYNNNKSYIDEKISTNSYYKTILNRYS